MKKKSFILNPAYIDSYRFIKKLSLFKLWNWALLIWSFYLAKWTKKPIHWGRPLTIGVEPTTACNLRCPECPSGLRNFTRPTGNLKTDFFRTIVDEQARQLVYLYFYFQGEPYINPAFLDMVRYAHQQGIYTVTSTNGHFLNDQLAEATVRSGLDRIIISIDGTTQEVYEQYRKEGKLEVVLQGARNLVKWKKKLKAQHPYIIFQFLVVGPNEHQVDEVQTLAQEIGVDKVVYKTAQIYNYKNGHPLIPKAEKYSRYRLLKNGTYEIKNRLEDHCWKLWHACVLTWDGRVIPCCFDKDAQYEMGNLRDSSFGEIWRNQTYGQFRQQVLKGRKHIDICTNCSEGTRVWAIQPEE